MERGGALLALLPLVVGCVALGYRRLHAAPSAAPPRSWRIRKSKRNATAPALAFVHIPRTGGTAIEDGGQRGGVLWGLSLAAQFEDTQTLGCSWWHVPPSRLPAVAAAPLRRRWRFCVVRHPMTRLLSEFLASRPSLRRRRPCELATARPAVRAWQARIQREFSAWVRRVLGSAAAMQRNFGSDCHFVSQVEYLAAGWRYAAEVVGDTQFGDDGAAALVDALVDDGVGCNLVLRHERLRGDFARVMAWARLNVTLGARRVVGTAKGVYELAADERPCAPAEAEALLDADARQLVRKAYARDLRELEYEGEVR